MTSERLVLLAGWRESYLRDCVGCFAMDRTVGARLGDYNQLPARLALYWSCNRAMIVDDSTDEEERKFSRKKKKKEEKK